MNKILEILGCRYPIIQGPIGSMNNPAMVSAVSESGAYGLLAMGFIREVEEAKRLVGAVRELTDKPFGANIVLLNPLAPKILEELWGSGLYPCSSLRWVREELSFKMDLSQ